MSCILIVGLGSIGRRHLGNLRALGYTDVVLCRTGKGPSGAAPIEGYRTERALAAALSHHPIATISAGCWAGSEPLPRPRATPLCAWTWRTRRT